MSYLCCGIATDILITERRDQYINEKKDKILKGVSRFINLDLYDININESNIHLTLKKKIVKDNIHDFLKELDKVMSCKYLFYNGFNDKYTLDVNSDAFNPKDYPLKLVKEKMDNGRYYYELQGKERALKQFMMYYDYKDWLLDVNDRPYLSCEIYQMYTWYDDFKYDGECEYNIVRILNTLKNGYFQNILKGCLLFSV